jgi:hypothetical protein
MDLDPLTIERATKEFKAQLLFTHPDAEFSIKIFTRKATKGAAKAVLRRTCKPNMLATSGAQQEHWGPRDPGSNARILRHLLHYTDYKVLVDTLGLEDAVSILRTHRYGRVLRD